MRHRRPRLLLLSPLPPPTGGIPTWTLGLLGSEITRRFEVRVVNTAPRKNTEVQGRSRFRADRVADAGRILLHLALELLRFRPDLVHVNTPYYWAFLRDGLAVWMSRAGGAKTLLHFRGGDFAEFATGTGPLTRRAVEATLRRADRLIALTGATRDYLCTRADPHAVRLIPNFVRLEDVGNPPDRSRREAGPVRVLFVGWLVEGKGVRELLQAARKLPEIRFTLVGPEQPDFLASIRSDLEALSDRVTVLPPQPREQVIELYREADVLALPSWREGFPNVVLEAMAAGLPIVATPVGAIGDAVRHGEEGLLVPVRDTEALIGALRALANDPELRRAMGVRARGRVESMFALDSVVRQLESVYVELLGDAQRR